MYAFSVSVDVKQYLVCSYVCIIVNMNFTCLFCIILIRFNRYIHIPESDNLSADANIVIRITLYLFFSKIYINLELQSVRPARPWLEVKGDLVQGRPWSYQMHVLCLYLEEGRGMEIKE